MAKFQFLLFFSVVVGFFATGSMAHDEHIVGGRDGWTIPPNATFYQDWAKTRNFKVGDRLVFPYTVEMYTVVEASKEDFDNCTQRDIKARYYAPPTVIELLEPGRITTTAGSGCTARPARSSASSSATAPATTVGEPTLQDSNVLDDSPFVKRFSQTCPPVISNPCVSPLRNSEIANSEITKTMYIPTRMKYVTSQQNWRKTSMYNVCKLATAVSDVLHSVSKRALQQSLVWRC
uniref:Phytocyanin domain-containing protein n=1 Tax=Ananas comosus var. bracteatus TaxID=296719 RepID=A0A6V7QWW4_ANACO